MIKQINNISQLNHINLKSDIYGRKIAAYVKAYGTNYPFCSVYLYENGNGSAAILRFNNSITMSGDAAVSDELYSFLNMLSPDIIEASDNIIRSIPILNGMNAITKIEFEMKKCGGGLRTAMDCSPKLDRVYEILSESFPELADFGMWLTDTSHRCRHGISRTFMYKNAAVASILFEDEEVALVGEIATSPEERGKGLARQMLSLIAEKLEIEGKKAVLFALPHRVGFYRQIGFNELSEHMIIMREEVDFESDIHITDEYTDS